MRLKWHFGPTVPRPSPMSFLRSATFTKISSPEKRCLVKILSTFCHPPVFDKKMENHCQSKETTIFQKTLQLHIRNLPISGFGAACTWLTPCGRILNQVLMRQIGSNIPRLNVLTSYNGNLELNHKYLPSKDVPRSQYFNNFSLILQS